LQACFRLNDGPLGILGPSGSGKSMLLRCIAGLEKPDQGVIRVNGLTLFDKRRNIHLKPQRRRVGYLFQNPAVFPHMTAEGNLACVMPAALSKSRRQADIDELLKRFSLESLRQSPASRLSGGEQQRLALARIFASRPETILLDECFSALDSRTKEHVRAETFALINSFTGGIVIVSHDIEDLYRFCSSLLLLKRGVVLGCGPMSGLFKNPGSIAAAELLGCRNFSPIRVTGCRQVRMLDWNIDVNLTEAVPPAANWIGLYDHAFSLYRNNFNADNAFWAVTAEKIEGTQITCRRFKPVGGSSSIWAKLFNTDRPAWREKLYIDTRALFFITHS
jgi:molybdate transport system ATP-binding protein